MGYGGFKDLEEQLLIKYYMMKHLILLKVENRMDIIMVLLQWLIIFNGFKSMKSWLEDNVIETNSTDNERKICCCRKTY